MQRCALYVCTWSSIVKPSPCESTFLTVNRKCMYGTYVCVWCYCLRFVHVGCVCSPGMLHMYVQLFVQLFVQDHTNSCAYCTYLGSKLLSTYTHCYLWLHVYTYIHSVCLYICTCTNYVVVKDSCLHMKTFILCEKSVLRHTVCTASAVYCAHTHYCGVLFYQFQICKLSICDMRICFPSTVGCVCCGRNKHFELQSFGDSQYLILAGIAHVRTCTCSYICREHTLLPPVDITGIIHALLENITTS